MVLALVNYQINYLDQLVPVVDVSIWGVEILKKVVVIEANLVKNIVLDYIVELDALHGSHSKPIDCIELVYKH